MSQDEEPTGADAGGAAHESRGRSRAGVASEYDTLVRITTPRLWVSLAALVAVVVAAAVWSVVGSLDDTVTGEGVVLPEGGLRSVAATADGVVESYAVEVGGEVSEGQTVATISGPDGDTQLTAPRDGIVVQRDAVEGRAVSAGDPVVVLAPRDAEQSVYAYVDVASGKAVAEGQHVKVTPEQAPAGGLSHFTGTVTSVSELPASSGEVQALTASAQLAEMFTSEPVLEVQVALDGDDTSVSGVASSNAHGDGTELGLGRLVAVEVVVGSSRPIHEVFS